VKAVWSERIVTEYIRGHWPSIFKKLVRHPTPMTDQLLKAQMAVRANKVLFYPEGRASARTIMGIYACSCRDRLSSIQVPTLLIWGEHDEIHTIKHGRYMHSHIPGSKLVVLADAGHWAMIDQRDRFNSELLLFFEKVSGSSQAGTTLSKAAPDS
jgi:pimeloyl-ACP methyl ester carboxylesterase